MELLFLQALQVSNCIHEFAIDDSEILASLRGKANFASFGSAKAGLRSLAQSMAKELGPCGIHVCHVVVDGPVDNPQTREYFGAALDHLKESDFIKPDQIGPVYYFLHTQKPSAWSFEIDIRTCSESW